MAKFLLTLQSSGSLDDARELAPPPDHLVEFESLPSEAADQGLERWSVALQIAGTVADWATTPAYDALWTHLGEAVKRFDVRPRAVVTIKSRADSKRVAVRFGYLGDTEMQRARDDLRQRITAALDPKSKRLKSDIDFEVHG